MKRTFYIGASCAILLLNIALSSLYLGRIQSQRPDANRVATPECRRILVDLGAYNGDTLATYGGDRFLLSGGHGGSFAAYVFEIDAGHIASILGRLDGPLKRLRNSTQVLNVASWNRDEVITVLLTGHNDGRVAAASEGAATTRVLAYDIGAWLMNKVQPRPCDEVLVKMDIEGAEVQSVESLHEHGALPLIDHFVVEWHDWLAADVRNSKQGLEKLLAEAGLAYRYATLDDALDTKYMPGDAWPVSHCDSHYIR